MSILMAEDKKTNRHASLNSSDSRLDVTSRSNSRAFYNNRDEEKLFSWLSDYICSAGEFVIYIKNTSSTEKLFIEHIYFGAGVNQQFYAHKVTGTATGTPITGKNQNYAESNSSTGVFFGDAAVGGLTSTWKSKSIRVLANDNAEWINSGGVILNNGEALAIQAKNAGAIDVTILGFCE